MSDPPATRIRPRLQPAWLMLGGAFTAFTVSAGLMHSYAVYLVAFIEEFGWSRAETSVAYSVSQLVAGVQFALCRGAGRPARPAPAAVARRRIIGAGAGAERLCDGVVADHPPLRGGDDGGRELPRARGVRADPVAPFRPPPRHGDFDRPIGQWARPRGFGAARAIGRIGDRLAPDLSGAGRADGGDHAAAGGVVPARRSGRPQDRRRRGAGR